jgi:hypothetical protein
VTGTRAWDTRAWGGFRFCRARVLHAPGWRLQIFYSRVWHTRLGSKFAFFFARNTETGRDDPRFDPDGSLFTGDEN